jgi:hypothetical protein
VNTNHVLFFKYSAFYSSLVGKIIPSKSLSILRMRPKAMDPLMRAAYTKNPI